MTEHWDIFKFTPSKTYQKCKNENKCILKKTRKRTQKTIRNKEIRKMKAEIKLNRKQKNSTSG